MDSAQDVLFNVIQTIALIIICSGSLRHVFRGQRSKTAAFFVFGIISYILSNIYWIAYDLLRPGVRMPFAVNEIGEWAVFLLLSAALSSACGLSSIRVSKEVVLAAVFTAANTAFWIGWSGEWLQDIFTGVAVGWLLCVVVSLLKDRRMLSRPEWIGLGAVSFLLAVLQTGTFFTRKAVSVVLDRCCYILIFISLALLLYKVIKAFRQGDAPERLLILSLAGFAWSTVCMYMSVTPYYFASITVSMVMLALAAAAVGKAVEQK